MDALLILTILAAGLFSSNAVNPCVKSELCQCYRSDGTVIDLTNMTQSLFTALDSEGAWMYDYSPCKSADLGDGCQGVVACQLNPIEKRFIPLGTPQNFSYNETDSGLFLVYQAGDRTTEVSLKCSSSGNDTLTFIEEKPPKTYHLELSSSHACAVPESTTSASTTATATATATASTTDNVSTTGTTSTTTGSNTTRTTTSTSTKSTSNTTHSSPTTTSPASNSTSSTISSSSKITSTTTSSSAPTTRTTEKTTQGTSAVSSMALVTLLIGAVFTWRLN